MKCKTIAWLISALTTVMPLWAMQPEAKQETPSFLHLVATLTQLLPPPDSYTDAPTIKLFCNDSYYQRTAEDTFDFDRATLTISNGKHRQDYIRPRYATRPSETDIPKNIINSLCHKENENNARFKMFVKLSMVDEKNQRAIAQCSIYKKFKEEKTLLLKSEDIQLIFGSAYSAELKGMLCHSAKYEYQFKIEASLENKVPDNQK